MSAFIPKEPSGSCQGVLWERAGTSRLVDSSGEGGEHKKPCIWFTEVFASSGRGRCSSADEG